MHWLCEGSKDGKSHWDVLLVRSCTLLMLLFTPSPGRAYCSPSSYTLQLRLSVSTALWLLISTCCWLLGHCFQLLPYSLNAGKPPVLDEPRQAALALLCHLLQEWGRVVQWSSCSSKGVGWS